MVPRGEQVYATTVSWCAQVKIRRAGLEGEHRQTFWPVPPLKTFLTVFCSIDALNGPGGSVSWMEDLDVRL